MVDTVLDGSALARYVPVRVSSDEVRLGKPTPQVYVEACRRLGVAPAQAAAVEDSSNGLRAAAAAGMAVIALPNGEFPPAPDALALADAVLASLDGLDAALLSHLEPSS